METCVINVDRYVDGKAFELDIVRENLSGLGLPSRRERWIVMARDEREAERTREYHFGWTTLWHRWLPASTGGRDNG